MGPVLQCISTLRAAFDYGSEEENNETHSRKKWDLSEVESLNGIDCSQGELHSIPNGDGMQSSFADSCPVLSGILRGSC